jgi:hypothetical protein
MAMMTAGELAVGEARWSRAMLKRASARGTKSGRGLKSTRGPKSDRGPETGRDQMERRCEEAICLARQAGPGPRI